MTDLDTRTPAFSIGIRGYDREQVDEYIDRLQGLLADAQARARDAEAEFMFDEHAAVGPRIAEIFALAEAEARELRDRVASRSDGLVDEARSEARAIVQAAEQGAKAITDGAERDRVEMVAEFERERERIRDEVAVLERRKAEAVGELNRLREMLAEAAGVGGPLAEIRDRAGVPARPIGSGDETVELPVVPRDLTEFDDPAEPDEPDATRELAEPKKPGKPAKP